MKKRLIAILLTVTLLVSMFPIGTVSSAEAEVTNDVIVTILDKNGDPVTEQDISVTVTRTYRRLFIDRTQNVNVDSYGDGVFGYDWITDSYTTRYYTISVSLTGEDNLTYSASEQVSADADSVVITMEDYVHEDRIETFGVYYIANGQFPEVFYSYGEPQFYGPAGDNTPLLNIDVNITKLKNEFSDVVLYQENVSNTYHFIPANISETDDYEENKGYASAFWDAVKECMTDESKKAFEATRLYDTFIGYCLKNQGSAASPQNHCDGILEVIPPVYVIEMYDQNGIFGGHTNDSTDIGTEYLTMNGVLDRYEQHFNQEIEWVDNNNGTWTGIYVAETDGRNYEYELTLTQSNIDQAIELDDSISQTDIKYQQMDKTNDTYYLAVFKIAEITDPKYVDCKITYTDGLEDDVIFYDQVHTLEMNSPAVRFTGKTDRENYIFMGWTLEGGDGTVLSQDDIIETYKNVTEDLTFVAVYMVAPTKYTATVEVILNGSYKSETATATGVRVDINKVDGEDTTLYLSLNGTDFIPLERTAEGIYTAKIENGTYIIYHYKNGEYTPASEQQLIINNDNRTRYLFFNSVDYDLNGGTGGPDNLKEYYHSEASVTVANNEPSKEGYIFAGWKDQDGNIYNSGTTLTSAISKAYTLTAQWEDAADIYVNVTINHGLSEGVYDHGENRDALTLELVYAPDSNTPYLESGHIISLSSENHPKHILDQTDVTKTIYTANGATLTNFDKDYLYTVTTSKHNYTVTSITSEQNTDGDFEINVFLDYAPQNQNLEFEVKIDKNVPSDLVPQAAIVKILFWSTDSQKWEIISQHNNVNGTYRPGYRVNFDTVDADGSLMGTGSYPVWANEEIDENNIQPFGYRIIVTSIVYPDGTIVSVNNDLLTNLTANETDLYDVTFGEVSQGKSFGEYNGAYFVDSTQNGTLDAYITTQGYNVIFDALGGTVNGYTAQTIPNQYKVPTFDGYLPVRDGGYVFEGWYKDTAFTISAVEGEYLKSDITFYAKWKEPLTIEGLVTVGATYEQLNEDSTTTTQTIHDADRIKEVLVILQKFDANGYTETVAEQLVKIDYSDSAFYHEGKIVGYSNYSFTGIPDLGTNYRIQVLVPNYTSNFQNENAENASINNPKDYPSYNSTDFIANFGTIEPTVATVNIHSHFSPEQFELEYSVNTESIGSGFHPQKVEVLVTYDNLNSGIIPENWPIISQMVFDGNYKGEYVTVEKGKGYGSDYIWIRRPDGITSYQYGIRVQNVVMADGSVAQFSDSLPFTVTYQAPAYVMNNAQSKELIATLTPKTYNVTFYTNGGQISGAYPTSHTWSYETSIAGIVPTFNGFRFAGWYLDAEFTQPADDYIDASVASDVNLYAKWIQVMDTVNLIVIINHEQKNYGGLASNYDKTLYTQLTYADRNAPDSEKIFVDMPGFTRDYTHGQWHTHGDKVTEEKFEVASYFKNLSSEYDYSVNVSLDGYYVKEKIVERSEEPRPDGSHLHTVTITLQYDPDLVNLDFYVEMAQNVPQSAYPQSAEVKLSSWYQPSVDEEWNWNTISQHLNTTITVSIDAQDGKGTGSYPVWQWYDAEENIPYFYRLEIIQLNFADGTNIPMNEVISQVSYSGDNYNAEIKVNSGSLPQMSNNEIPNTTLNGVYGQGENSNYTQVGTLGAVIDINKIIFHTNNQDALNNNTETDDDTFRTYYPYGTVSADSGHYSLNENGSIPAFYDIPEFEYAKHNDYVFKGWYLDKDTADRPVDWSATFDETTHIYAHWIETGSVAKDAEDDKNTIGDSYVGFDLIGAQIRNAKTDDSEHYGTPGSGLRFITVLSENLYSQINSIEGNGAGAEYGFVIAKSSTAKRYSEDRDDYTLQYKGSNVNGVDTTSSYSYVQNFKCSGVADHYNGDNYRLYTAVITYNSATDDNDPIYQENIVARSYIRYIDANGIERIRYNNYTGTSFYNGFSTSYATIRSIVS